MCVRFTLRPLDLVRKEIADMLPFGLFDIDSPAR
jgi:hypothetical protein